MRFIFPNRGLSWFNENRLSLFQIQSHYSIVPLFIQPWQTQIYWVISACSHIAIPTTKTKHRLYEWSIYFEWILSDYVKSQRYRLVSEASRCLPHYSSYKTECKINMENHLSSGAIYSIFWKSGPWFNIQKSSYQYWKSHCGDKTILRPYYLHNGISYSGKMTSLYWIGAQVL